MLTSSADNASVSPEMRLAEEAATWFVRLRDPGCSIDERCAFEDWLAASAEHRREYEQIAALWGNLDRLGDYAPRTRQRKRRRVAAAALSLVLAAGLGYLSLGTEQVYTTALGEYRRVELADGSIVDLNTGSEMHARISFWSRRVELARGEAMFDVAREAHRAFEVRAAGTVLRDIGTRFNVRLDRNAVTVEVLEGAVEVQPPSGKTAALLTAGKRAVSDANGITGLAQVDAEAACAWTSGRWIFRSTRLDEVVRELNRYHPQQTELADSSLGKLRIDGVFNTADRAGLLKALETLLPLRVEEGGGVTRLDWKPRSS